MILKVEDSIKPKISEGFEIKVITNEEDLVLFSKITEEGFSTSEEASKSFTKLLESAGFKGPFYHLIGKKNGKVVCSGSLLCNDSGAYIYNVATTKSERNRGYAINIVYALILLAKDKQKDLIGLISSPQAFSIYSKLGFKQIASYHIYAN
jgi:predicted GNAT family acetyltransferase